MNTATMEKIPCLDLKGQHKQVKEEIFEVFEKVYANTAFSGGPFVQEFEKSFAKFCNTPYAIGVNSGTSALQLAMNIYGVGVGDEVIIPANTFISTAWAVAYVGATPVFVDCLSDTWEIDPEDVKKKITDKTKGIIGVHLYGQPFDFDAVKEICDEHDLFLIEDAAQAHGAEYKGRRCGSLADLACFSFYPGKNLGATGEGGGITTNNEAMYTRLQALRNHGCKERYYHDEIGYNMRMGGLEGGALNVKMKYIEGWNNRRKEIAKRYQQEISNVKIKMQAQPEFVDSVYHLFVITTENRDELLSYLNEKNIFPALHYPVPCHLQKAFNYLGCEKGSMPNSEYLADHCLSLPMFAELTDEQVKQIINTLNAY